MIVPGEASESDEDELTPSASSAPPNVVPILPKSAVAQTPSPTASSGATIASQLTSKVNSVTEAAVKQFGNLSRQATLDDFMTGVSTVYYSTASNTDSMTQEEIVGEREQSLLHAKLFEKNASLSRNVDAAADETVGGVPRQVSGLLGNYSRTQVYFQDAVLSMQQANHFCAEALESMDDFLETASRQRFPQ